MIQRAEQHNLVEVATLLPEFRALSRFIEGEPAVFVESWQRILNAGFGVIFMLVVDGACHGAIGGMEYRDPCSGKQVATEAFWFVRETHRGSVASIRLYLTFERWARERGCEQIQMVHMADVDPKRLAGMYRRMGFELMEVRYVKDLKEAA